jgi:hypothetical protein
MRKKQRTSSNRLPEKWFRRRRGQERDGQKAQNQGERGTRGRRFANPAGQTGVKLQRHTNSCAPGNRPAPQAGLFGIACEKALTCNKAAASPASGTFEHHASVQRLHRPGIVGKALPVARQLRGGELQRLLQDDPFHALGAGRRGQRTRRAEIATARRQQAGVRRPWHPVGLWSPSARAGISGSRLASKGFSVPRRNSTTTARSCPDALLCSR